jgi:hypothetical protein
METIVVVNGAWSCLHPYIEDGYLSSTEIVRLTGITYRKLEYWYSSGVFGPTKHCGSGQRRLWHESVIKKIRILVDVSNEMGQFNNTSVRLLTRIFENYDHGWIQFSEHTSLEWEVL